MKLTWYGHAFFEIEAENGTNILIDPFMENNPLNDVSADDFDPDIVGITHGHFDHVSEAHKFDATFVCQPEITNFLGSRGVPEDNLVGFNIGGTYEQDGVAFTMLQAFHSSGTPGEGDFDGYGGTATSLLVDDGETKFFHAGDTGLFGDMKTVINEVYDPDIAAVPIGDHFTMGPEEAGKAADWLGVDSAIPIHYNTFPPIEQDPQDFVEATDADVHVLDVGETLEY